MRGTNSPSDPVFYLHHCWIDRMWAQWQEADAGAKFNSFELFAESGMTGAFGLDDPLVGIGGTARAQLNYKALGYDYIL
jgi:Common central domain of tyrosinase